MTTQELSNLVESARSALVSINFMYQKDDYEAAECVRKDLRLFLNQPGKVDAMLDCIFEKQGGAAVKKAEDLIEEAWVLAQGIRSDRLL
jgi:hypothetical protein